jgi:hypothetical protein
MQGYEAIEEYVRRARIERSVYIAELIATAIVASWNAVKQAADVLLSVARSKNPKGVFTFDA